MRRLLFTVAIAGLLVSGYLFIAYATGGPILCNTGHGCDVVRGSEYASFWGIPTPAYGMVYYILLAVGALLATSERWSRMRWGLLALTTSGAAVSAYLTYLEAYVIEAWCSWCVASAVLAAAAYVLVLLGWRSAFTSINRDSTLES